LAKLLFKTRLNTLAPNFIAIFTAFLTLAILTVLRLLEEKIFGKEE